MRIGVYLPLAAPQIERLRRGVDGCVVTTHREDDACDCEIVFGNPSASVVRGNASLKWVQLESVGFGEYADLDWQRASKPATVTNLAGFFAEPVAETALAGILALHRGIDRLVNLQASRHWLGDPLRTELRTLGGASVLLFGRGAINGRLAELLAPFACDIVSVAKAEGLVGLDAALGQAEVVVCTVPSTPQTQNVFGRERFAHMRPGAVFCNFGRGSLVDEPALVEALRQGHLAGAVIDVTRNEPLPADHAFWACPNLILTQHSAGGTADELDRKVDVFLDNFVRFRAGQPLLGAVDFSRGY